MSGIVLAVVIGLLGGLGAVGFRHLIAWFQSVFFGEGLDLLARAQVLPWWKLILIPAVGGLFVGPIVYFFAREARGHGVPEVMEAVALRGGRIRKRVAAVKALASSICIGSGGSVGREGPIIQIGSAIGSAAGQLLRVSESRMKTLVGCGAAAGIAATFNAPIAGAMFAIEVIVGEFGIITFSPIVISSVIATAVSRHMLENTPAFPSLPAYDLVHVVEIPLYAVLGIVAALLATGFSWILYKGEDFFERRKRIPPYLMASVGGLILGVIGIWFPQVFGNGYEAITLALNEQTGLGLLLILVVMKTLATSVTLGSGGSGGVFAPSLFIGAMGGGAFGILVGRIPWLEGLVASPGAYTLVGMGAVVAGTTHAPISAIIILFEMTGDYRIILPLMLACVISTLLSNHILKESIYTLKLVRRGLNIRAGRDVDLLRSIRVEDVMERDVQTLGENIPIHDVLDHFEESRHLTYPVVDSKGRLSGIVSYHDYAEALRNEALQNLVLVGEVATRAVITVHPEDDLSHALHVIGNRHIETLPVVDAADPRRLVGILNQQDILFAYQKALARKSLAGR
ncbi:MAG: chloride channel protein [Planctomycetota bacterium]|nr:chloride channel protein [Planctomycetota bacterium]